MNLLLFALAAVAYLTIGAVIAGVADRHVHPEGRNGPFIAALWPAYLVTVVLCVAACISSTPFRALYRRIRGNP